MNRLLKVIPLYKNESELIRGALANNRAAQRVLFDTFSPKMLSVCRYYIRDVQEAEDVMLNGFFKVFKNLSTYKGKGSFEGWIRRIMVNEALSNLRKKTPPVDLKDEDFHETVDNNAHFQLEVEELQALIDDLPAGYRMVFVLYAIEGYSHKEIGEMLDIEEGTSKSQLHKARRLLQTNLKRLNKTGYGTT